MNIIAHNIMFWINGGSILKARDFYDCFTRNELIEIAKKLAIPRIYSLNKEELKEIIIKTLKNKENLTKILSDLPPRAVFILKIVLGFRKFEADKKAVINEYLRLFDKYRFSQLLRELESVGLATEFVLDDKSYIIIPYEIGKKLVEIDFRKFLPKKTDVRSYRELLLRANTDKLRIILERRGLKKTGNKEELVSRIIKESNINPIQVISEAFSKEELIKFAEALKVKATGSKEEISQKIAIALNAIKETEVTRIKKQAEPEEELFGEVIEELKKFRLPKKPKNEEYIELALFSYLKAKFEPKIRVVHQALGVKRGKFLVPDITLGDKIAIEIKYIKTSSDRQRLVGQLMDYKRNYEYVIAYCYDPNGKIDNDFKEVIKRHLGKKVEIITTY